MVLVLFAVFALLMGRIEGNLNNSSTFNMSTRLLEFSNFVLKSCAISDHRDFTKTYILLRNCFEKRVFFILDQLQNQEVIEVSKSIKIIKFSDNATAIRKPENILLGSKWKNDVLYKFLEICHTRALNINLAKFVDYNSTATEARRRNRRQNMMGPLVMFGFIAMLMILIPMGFKFLTVLGAKALLLSKMALILTSIQGLKKVATSGINYGLYQAPPNQGHYERLGFLDHMPDDQLDSLHYYRS